MPRVEFRGKVRARDGDTARWSRMTASEKKKKKKKKAAVILADHDSQMSETQTTK